MTVLPRVECPRCRRRIAAAPVAGAPTRGRLWRHDEPGTSHRRAADGSLLSCPGSLELVDLPPPGTSVPAARPPGGQLVLGEDDEADQEPGEPDPALGDGFLF
jgi:hypothetical protein